MTEDKFLIQNAFLLITDALADRNSNTFLLLSGI